MHRIEGLLLKTAPPIGHRNTKTPQKPPEAILQNNVLLTVLLSKSAIRSDEQELNSIGIKCLKHSFYDILAHADVISAEPISQTIISFLRLTSKVSQLIDR